jgi:hypothetical protein
MNAILVFVALTFATAASAQTTFRDGSGRITGTVSTEPKPIGMAWAV